MRKKLLSLLLILSFLLIGCSKTNSGENTDNNTNVSKEESISAKDILLNNYWFSESDGFKYFKNFNDASVITLDPNGLDDLNIESIESMEVSGNTIVAESTLYGHDITFKTRYSIEVKSEDSIDVTYTFKIFDDGSYESQFTETYHPTSLDTVRNELSSYYPTKSYSEDRIEYFQKEELN